MTLDKDVQTIAAQWGIDPHLIQAVVNAEGGGDAIIKAVRCSLPNVTTRAKALEVLCRSATHAMSSYITDAGLQTGFVFAFGARWAPASAANDPKNLNTNWVPNVLRLWTDASQTVKV